MRDHFAGNAAKIKKSNKSHFVLLLLLMLLTGTGVPDRTGADKENAVVVVVVVGSRDKCCQMPSTSSGTFKTSLEFPCVGMGKWGPDAGLTFAHVYFGGFLAYLYFCCCSHGRRPAAMCRVGTKIRTARPSRAARSIFRAVTWSWPARGQPTTRRGVTHLENRTTHSHNTQKYPPPLPNIPH